MAENVQLPRGRRVAAEHITLKPYAVHQVSDRCLRAGEVGVGLVVGAAHDLYPALGDQPPQVGAVFGVGVPVRLEVVDFGEHELVFGFAAGHLQMRVNQLETVGLPGLSGRVLGPQAGVAALGVPPHRVVVEVADHEHRPPGLGDGESKRCRGPRDVHLGGPPLADNRVLDGNGHLDGALPNDMPDLGQRLPAQAIAVYLDQRGLRAAADGHPRQLQRRVGGPTKNSVDSAEITRIPAPYGRNRRRAAALARRFSAWYDGFMPALASPVTDERSAFREYLAFHQSAFFAVAYGLTDEQVRSRPTVSALSIGGLIKHATSMQRSWMARVAAAPNAPPRDTRPFEEISRDFADQHVMRPDETLADLLSGYRAQNAASLHLVDTADLDAVVPVPTTFRGPEVSRWWSVRWVILHVNNELRGTPGTPTSSGRASTAPPCTSWSPAWRAGRSRAG